MKSLPSICLVDTNVVIAANGREQLPGESLSVEQMCCTVPCIEVLRNITSGECKLVLDDSFHIIGEYKNKVNPEKQKGVGAIFLKWVLTNWNNPAKIDIIPITPIGDESFEELPTHDGLKDFDRSDRKFIATANAHKEKPPIVQATDSKWWGWKDALEAVGLRVFFVHEDYIREKYQKKMGQN